MVNDDKVIKMNLEEAMTFLFQNLDPKFAQDQFSGFRAELNDNLDIAVFCLSQYPPSRNNTHYKYVIQTLSKNNTIKSQTVFDDVRDAVDIVNSQVRGY